MSLEDSESLPPYYYFKKKIEWILKEYKYVGGLNEVICQLIELKELNFYNKLTEKLKVDNGNFIVRSLKVGIPLTREEIQKVPLIKIGSENLNDPFLYPYFKKDLVNFPDFYFLYKFLELSYFLSLGRKLRKEDLEKLYFCRLDELIIQKLDHFDEFGDFEINAIKDNFFIKLKNLKCNTKNTQRFFVKLNNTKTEIIYDLSKFSDDELFSTRDFPSDYSIYTPSKMIPTFPPLNKKAYLSYFMRGANRSIYPINPINIIFRPFGNPYLNFPATENAFLLFLAGCSAVNSDRDVINENDVIRAYKAYYKLLTANIPRIVDRLLEEKSNGDNGYLVCERCNKYYKLRPGESPEEFTDQCECGGKLNYYDNIDWLLNKSLSESNSVEK
jgi:hypothetical protein